jgi:hypothetical protein
VSPIFGKAENWLKFGVLCVGPISVGPISVGPIGVGPIGTPRDPHSGTLTRHAAGVLLFFFFVCSPLLFKFLRNGMLSLSTFLCPLHPSFFLFCVYHFFTVSLFLCAALLICFFFFFFN